MSPIVVFALHFISPQNKCYQTVSTISLTEKRAETQLAITYREMRSRPETQTLAYRPLVRVVVHLFDL